MEYNFSAIEQKWQQFWQENGTYKVSNGSDKPKFYVLDMFPYPSGAGLHVGHPLGYIASDIYSRYKRMKGFNVLHPMGFDAFGLPAEQYAIQQGLHPDVTTKQNIKTFKGQLNRLGFDYDWDREVKTCDPDYYKWTQWIFLQLFACWYNKSTQKAEPIDTLEAAFRAGGSNAADGAGGEEVADFSAEDWNAMSEAEQQKVLMNFRLAYLSHASVNWCEALGTVLANDEVKEGVSERGGHPVERRLMRQWFLRTTAYADRLLDDLDDLDWSDAMKEMQRNWIGRSEGASVWFDIADTDKKFEVFTTRPDTIYGVTFMVLAPEHDLVAEVTSAEQKQEVEGYVSYVKARTDRERQMEKKVTGAFTGAYAVHPFSGEKVPIYISEYVLIGYGTGAIMAVPSDDDRDEVFAQHFDIPIVDIIDKSKYPGATKSDKLGIMINSGFMDGMEVPDAIKAAINAVEEKGIGTGKVNYRLRDAGYSRQRYWGEPFPIVYRDEMPYALGSGDLPLTLPEVSSYKPTGSGDGPLAALTDWVNTPDGKRETDTMPGYAGSSWYFLRYMSPQCNDRFVDEKAEQYWQNVDLYIGGTEHAVGHLLYSRTWQKFMFDRGWVSQKEPFKRLVNQGMIQGMSRFVYRKKGTNTFVSHGLIGEHEVTPLHVDVNFVDGLVMDTERFKAWRAEYNDAEFILEDGQYICGSAVEKMSKSKFNVVNPDDIVNQYGADCLRMFEMFLGPIDQGKPWNTQGISGVSKFLRRFWNLFRFDENGQANLDDATPTADEMKILHKTIKKVNEDIDRMGFNTCVSAFMEATNALTEKKCNKRAILKPMVALLAPFAPFVTEELWRAVGESGSVHHSDFPTHDEQYLVENSKEYPIQINGKVRTKISIALDADKAAVEAVVMGNDIVKQWTDGKTLRKFVYVPGKIINVVAN